MSDEMTVLERELIPLEEEGFDSIIGSTNREDEEEGWIEITDDDFDFEEHSESQEDLEESLGYSREDLKEVVSLRQMAEEQNYDHIKSMNILLQTQNNLLKSESDRLSQDLEIITKEKEELEKKVKEYEFNNSLMKLWFSFVEVRRSVMELKKEVAEINAERNK